MSEMLRMGKKSADMLGQSQMVETRVVEPQSFTQQSVRFNLPKSGILDNNCYVTLSMTASDANQNFNLFSGISSVIETATLYHENTVITQTRNVNSLMALKNWFRNPSKRKQVMNTRIGSFTDFMVEESTTGVKGQYSLDKKIKGISKNGANYQVDSAFKIGTTPDQTGEYKLFLQDMFPMMSQLQLPLGLLGQFSLVLDFAQDFVGERVVPSQGNAFTAGNNIVPEKCKMVCDLIYYENKLDETPVMERLAEELKKGVTLTFTDNVSVKVGSAFKKINPAVTAGTKQSDDITHLLGLNQQVVRKIFAAVTPTPDFVNNVPSNVLAGNCVSEGTQAVDEEVEIVINNQPVYPSSIDLDCKLWNELSQTFPTPFKAPVGLTSFEGQVKISGNNKYDIDISQNFGTDRTLHGHPFSSLDGTAHYYGFNLCKDVNSNEPMNGTAVGNQPVTIRMKRGRVNQQSKAYDLLIWAECERALTMKDDQVYVSGA